MGYDFQHVEEVKNSRRQYRCYHCGQKTEKRRYKNVQVFEGDFHASQFHPECWSALSHMERDHGDYWPDEFSMARGRTDGEKNLPPEYDEFGKKI